MTSGGTVNNSGVVSGADGGTSVYFSNGTGSYVGTVLHPLAAGTVLLSTRAPQQLATPVKLTYCIMAFGSGVVPLALSITRRVA